ncbi:MAG: phosphate acyltransferase PlsX [Phycisphaerae bacterium]|jgi:glycerol-3-phosphate acyltransferase PlsX|nr:phosphate acyltransferase PlsX [Phycisphaerae bacterium]
MRLAIDAMGGDYAPKEIVAGAVLALDLLTEDDRLVLIGQEDRIRTEFAALDQWNNDPRIEIVHTRDIIEMGDHPVEALRQKRDNSISRMAQMAADGEADAVISAGNTGACVAACQMKIRPIKGVSRPGIAVVIPSFAGPIIMCDVGANPMPKPHHLHEYALMASIYYKCLFKTERPKVALLNIGEEDDKGNPFVRQVRDLIKPDPRLNYVGYVEGRTLLAGAADVVICDGFVGNVVLKLIEGLTDGLTKALFQTLEHKDPKTLEVLGPILKEACQKHDYSEHGGAPLIGVDGICIICHGVSNRRAIRNAIALALSLARSNVNQHIVESINNIPDSSTDCACRTA